MVFEYDEIVYTTKIVSEYNEMVSEYDEIVSEYNENSF